jgi:hypothetical protein
MAAGALEGGNSENTKQFSFTARQSFSFLALQSVRHGHPPFIDMLGINIDCGNKPFASFVFAPPITVSAVAGSSSSPAVFSQSGFVLVEGVASMFVECPKVWDPLIKCLEKKLAHKKALATTNKTKRVID